MGNLILLLQILSSALILEVPTSWLADKHLMHTTRNLFILLVRWNGGLDYDPTYPHNPEDWREWGEWVDT